MRNAFILFLFTCICVSFISCKKDALVKGKTFIEELDSIPQELDSARLELWIPASVGSKEQIRGVLSCSGYSKEILADNHWRQFAAEQKMAILIHHVQEYFFIRKRNARPNVNKVTINTIINGVDRFSVTTGHPELKYAPFVHYGHSASGKQGLGLASVLPERSIAVIVKSPAKYRDQKKVLPETVAVTVPTLILFAENEHVRRAMPVRSNENVLKPAREKGAPWAGVFVGGAVHGSIPNPSLEMAWLKDIIKIRLPETTGIDKPVVLKTIDVSKGWLGKLEFDSNKIPPCPKRVTIFPFDSYLSKECYWLPNEKIAKEWQIYCKVKNNVLR